MQQLSEPLVLRNQHLLRLVPTSTCGLGMAASARSKSWAPSAIATSTASPNTINTCKPAPPVGNRPFGPQPRSKT